MNLPKVNRFVFSSLGLFLVLFIGWNFIQEEPQLVSADSKWKGVCWVAGRSPLVGGELGVLKSVGVDAISQTPFGWQSRKDTPEIQWELENERKWWGESATGIKVTMDSSTHLGMLTILKPHLWVRGSWPGEIQMQNEDDWKKWFANYQLFILDYAKLANDYNIPLLAIGTELELTTHRESDWRGIIREIRKVYDGKLVYAANFTEFDQIAFWDALDYIGIQAYFPLSARSNSSLNELKKGWSKHLTAIDAVVRKFAKPVIFTEIGYCNTEDAAVEPWVWPNERRESAFSDEMQAQCYEAFFQTAWKRNWLAGVFFWKWYPTGHDREPDFTPQGKAAESVMRKYFLEG